MLVLEILILLILLLIFVQDIRARSVYWILFPLLAGALILLNYWQLKTITSVWQPVSINLGFIILQYMLVTVYFSLRQKKLVNISDQLLGFGDILFLGAVAFYLSVLNFLFFYITSLIGSLIIWLIWQLFSSKKSKEIPLAGFQSILLILFLVSCWWGKLFDLTDDAWLLNLVSK